MSVKYAVVIFNADVNKEPRFIRQVQAIKAAGLTPIIFSFSDTYKNEIVFQLPIISINPVDVNKPVLIRKVLSLKYRLKTWLSEWLNENFSHDDKKVAKKILWDIQPYIRNVKVVVAHHLHNVPVSNIIAEVCGVKLIFNAHEFYPEQFSGYSDWEKYRAKLNNIGRKYLKKTHKIFTVCPGIQERYKKDFFLNDEQQVSVTNATAYYELAPTPTEDKIRLIHHGIASRYRKVELMIDVADKVISDKFEFYFMLIPSQADTEYFDYIKEEIAKRKNCFLLDAVPTVDIPKTINKYDVGFYVYEPGNNFNMKHYLPNKLFEFIQGRLGIVIGPYVEMKDIVDKYDLGIVTKDNKTESFAKAISSLTAEDICRYKMNANIAAKELNGEREIEKMAKVFAEL